MNISVKIFGDMPMWLVVLTAPGWIPLVLLGAILYMG